MEKIDNLDRKILNMVMRNARMPSKDIAAVCGDSHLAGAKPQPRTPAAPRSRFETL